jgi:hypothetical protein
MSLFHYFEHSMWRCAVIDMLDNYIINVEFWGVIRSTIPAMWLYAEYRTCRGTHKSKMNYANNGFVQQFSRYNRRWSSRM